MFRVLVVEDDKDLNKSVCSFLNHSGYETTGCLNAADAYDAMYETVFDIIVSDIMMPGADGFEFAQNVRALNREIPILFMTARDDMAWMTTWSNPLIWTNCSFGSVRCCAGQRSPPPAS